MGPTVEQIIAAARRRLADAPFHPAGREAALLLGWMLGWSEAQVLARGDRHLAPDEEARFAALLERRLAGEPFAYLTGEREFYGRPFAVDGRVLIPRPETEHLVATVLALRLPEAPRILDVGVGSGAIAVTLALELHRARVVGTDRSPSALAVAAVNARRLGADDRVLLVAADLFDGLDVGRFDVVVSNPPYVDPADAEALSPEIRRFEPHLALFAPGGTGTLENLIQGAARRLAPGASLVLEIGRGQAAAVERAAGQAGLGVVEAVEDYAGVVRVVRLVHPAEHLDPLEPDPTPWTASASKAPSA